MKVNVETFIIIAVFVIVLALAVTAVIANDNAISLSEFIRNVARYLDQSEPPKNHPARNKQLHERLTALATIVQQLQMDADANSHPITVRHDCVQVAGHAYWLGEVYAATWEPGR